MNPIQNHWGIVKKKIKEMQNHKQEWYDSKIHINFHRNNEIKINYQKSYKICQDVSKFIKKQEDAHEILNVSIFYNNAIFL